MPPLTSRPVEETRKGGVVDHTCHVCGCFGASRGVGWPMINDLGPDGRPVLRWYCGWPDDCLPIEFMVGNERARREVDR